jgi:hypothetical protein
VEAQNGGSSFQTAIWYRANHDGGTVTVSATHGLDAVGFFAAAQEWGGFGSTVTVDDSDALIEGSSLTSHTCSAAGVTSTNECVAFCACALNATASECNPGASYTEITSGRVHNRSLFQYRHFASGCSGELGAWSTTGTARIGQSSIALLRGPAAGGGGGGRNPNHARLLGGIG